MDYQQLEAISRLAGKALIYEVTLAPKPGLVDRFDTGAHKDMDIYLFINSSYALTPYFTNYIIAGYEHQGALPELFLSIREIGKAAESKMLLVTGGVNTHKGANFSFAVVLAATGFFFKKSKKAVERLEKEDTNEILRISAAMCKGLTTTDLSKLSEKEHLTYGEILFQQYGFLGIRGEAEGGFPCLKNDILPFLREHKHLHKEEILLKGLLLLMSRLEDGNILHRGGIGAWEQVKLESKALFEHPMTLKALVSQLGAYNQQLIAQNISPGGSADLLAVAIFFAFLEGIIH